MMCRCKSINCKIVLLWLGMLIVGEAVRLEGSRYMKFTQFCCEPKIVLNIKSI